MTLALTLTLALLFYVQVAAIPLVEVGPILQAEGGAAAGVGACAVCLEEFAPEDGAKQLPGCGHLFHSDCIEQWLTRHNATCPVDGLPVEIDPVAVAEAYRAAEAAGDRERPASTPSDADTPPGDAPAPAPAGASRRTSHQRGNRQPTGAGGRPPPAARAAPNRRRASHGSAPADPGAPPDPALAVGTGRRAVGPGAGGARGGRNARPALRPAPHVPAVEHTPSPSDLSALVVGPASGALLVSGGAEGGGGGLQRAHPVQGALRPMRRSNSSRAVGQAPPAGPVGLSVGAGPAAAGGGAGTGYSGSEGGVGGRGRGAGGRARKNGVPPRPLPSAGRGSGGAMQPGLVPLVAP